jgi:hypothetical protein
MNKQTLKALNHQLLEAIETSGNDELKAQLLPSIKKSIDATVIDLLQKRDIAVPGQFPVPDITQDFFHNAGNTISAQFAFGVSTIRDLVITPTNTSFFMEDVVNFINLINGVPPGV